MQNRSTCDYLAWLSNQRLLALMPDGARIIGSEVIKTCI